MRPWRNGSRASLRCWCSKGRPGSSPGGRTIARWRKGSRARFRSVSSKGGEGSIPSRATNLALWWNGRHAGLRNQCFGVGVQIPPGPPTSVLQARGETAAALALRASALRGVRVQVPPGLPCERSPMAEATGSRPVGPNQSTVGSTPTARAILAEGSTPSQMLRNPGPAVATAKRGRW